MEIELFVFSVEASKFSKFHGNESKPEADLGLLQHPGWSAL